MSQAVCRIDGCMDDADVFDADYGWICEYHADKFAEEDQKIVEEEDMSEVKTKLETHDKDCGTCREALLTGQVDRCGEGQRLAKDVKNDAIIDKKRADMGLPPVTEETVTTKTFGAPAEDDDNFSVKAESEEMEVLRIPEGTYRGKCINVEKGTSKSSGNPMWTWTFVIMGQRKAGHTELDTKFAGKEYKLYTVITPQAMWKLREVIAAVTGKACGKDINFTKQDVIGREVRMSMKDDTYQGVEKSKLDKVQEC